MSKYLLSAALFLVLPLAASASTSIVSLTPQKPEVTVGDTIHIILKTNTTGASGTENDHLSTLFDVVTDGIAGVCVPQPNHSIGAGTNLTATWDYLASTTGNYTINATAYRGANCSGVSVATSTTLKVKAVVITPPPTPVDDSHARSGSIMVCNAAHGKQWVTETSGTETYRACRPITSVVKLPVCAMLNVLGTNTADYCVGVTPEQTKLWSMNWFVNIVTWMYNGR